MDSSAHEAAEDHETYTNVAPDDNKKKDPGNQSGNAAATLVDVESFQLKQPESRKESNAGKEGSGNTVTQDGQSSDDTTARIGSDGAEKPASAAEDSPKENGPPASSTIEGAIGRVEEKEGGEQGQAKDEAGIPERKTKKVTVMEGNPETLGAPRGDRYAQPGLSGQLANGMDLKEEVYRNVHHSSSLLDRQLASSPTSSQKGTESPKTGARKELGKSMQKSQFGKMVDSIKQSAPSIAFGSADRFSHGSIGYVPSGEGVPGPGCYETAKELGKDLGSSEHSHHPAYHFGNEERFKAAGTSGFVRMPDPGKYDVPSSIGRQTLSTKQSASPKSFVKAIRNVKVSIGKGFEEDMYGLDAPGPGTYSSKSGFGTQATSEKSTSPNFGFGTNARSVGGGRSLDERKASELPGPGEYVTLSSVGPQVESDKPSKPAFPFGSAGRSGKAGKSAAPGPGAYKNEKSGFGAQLVSPKRSMPAVSFTSASRFPRSPSEQTPGPGSYCN